MSKIVEITVAGPTGTGKSEALEIIKKALIEHYGEDTTVIDDGCVDGAIDEAKFTGQTAKDNVFVLVEENKTR